MSNIEKLLKSELKKSGYDKSGSDVYMNSKRAISKICRSLTTDTSNYEAQKTMDTIVRYVEEKEKLDRILYSQISYYIFSLDMAERGIFATNVEKLLQFSLKEENCESEDCRKIIIKIFDHFSLALHQIENANNIFANSIDEVKTNFKKEIKVIEKEYISILGIFAAIVLAFVGGITFSSSVLQNMSDISIYRLILIVALLAFVLLNVIDLLVKLIFTINELEAGKISFKWFNIVILFIAVITILGWLLNFEGLPEYIKGYLPWGG